MRSLFALQAGVAVLILSFATLTPRPVDDAAASGETYVLAKLVDTNDEAPTGDGRTFSSFDFGSYEVNDSLEVAFTGNVGPDSGVFVASGPNSGRVVALVADGAPETGGTFAGFRSPSINSLGEVAFMASVSGGTADWGIFKASGSGTIGKVILADVDPVPGLGSIDGSGCGDLCVNENGAVAFQGSRSIPWDTLDGVFIASADGAITAVEYEDQNTPGSFFKLQISRGSLNDAGQVGFWGVKGGPYGLFIGPPRTAVALVGDTAPGTGGGTFAGFSIPCFGYGFGPAVNNGGDAAFIAEVADGDVTEGEFLASGGSISPIALEGQTAPGTGGGTFSHFVSRPQLNNSGDLAFLSYVSGGTASRGIFVASDDGINAAALQDQTAPGSGGGGLDVTNAVPAISHSGEVAFRADVVGGNTNQGIYLALPGSGDSDSDGMTNEYESTHSCLNPLMDDAAADPDSDGLDSLSEQGLGTDPCLDDTDSDGCADGQEVGEDPVLGGTRDPLDFHDFYDVPVPTIHSGGDMNNRDSAVTLFNDVLGVLEYTGAIDDEGPNGGGRDYDDDWDGDGIDDGIAYDRSVGAPWPELGVGKSHTGPPDGGVTLFVDVLLVLDQVGHICQAAP